MENNEHINKLIDGALNSLDNAERAIPKPYLFTRLNARMQNATESNWDTVLRFISKPAFAFASVCLVVAINAMAIASSYPEKQATVTEDQYTPVDEYSGAATVLNDSENIEL